MIDLTPARTRLSELAQPRDTPVEAAVAHCARRLLENGGDRAAIAFRVPGRIELFGKHTDYAGGRSVLCCTGCSFVFVAAPRPDRTVQVTAVETGDTVRLAVSSRLAPSPGTWTDYLRTVIRRIHANFPDAPIGADIAFLSDIPRAAGLSSSSALVTGLTLTLIAIGRIVVDVRFRRSVSSLESLAEYAAAIETGTDWHELPGARGVGTEGGSQDHTAILCGRADHVVRYAFAPVTFEDVAPLPSDWLFAVGASGVRAEKTAGALEKYNRLSRLAAEAAARWRAAYGGDARHLGDILRASSDGEDLLKRFSAIGVAEDDPILARTRQFVEESAFIVPAALDAFRTSDTDALGRIAARSHLLADRDLGNQTNETNTLVALARRYGAFAASPFGAGFGGSVWAAVGRDDAHTFARRWRDGYARAFPARADDSTFLVGGAAPPAQRVA